MGAESLFSRVKDMVSHVVDSFIPIAEDEEEEEEIRAQQASQTAQTTQAAQSFASERRVANGGTVSSFSSPSYGSTSSFQSPRTPVTGEGSSTPLTVHTTKVSELRVRIHRPRRYDDAAPAVVQLKQGIAIAVNFDCMSEPERRRVCDSTRRPTSSSRSSFFVKKFCRALFWRPWYAIIRPSVKNTRFR